MKEQALSCASCGAGNKWVRPDDKLPEYNKEVLVYSDMQDGGVFFLAKLVESEDELDDYWVETTNEDDFLPEFTAWMPLPEQPETNLTRQQR